jgi:hypothetical protein
VADAVEKSQTDLRPISCRKTKHVRDGRTYGSENSRSAMQKDFFDSIDPSATLAVHRGDDFDADFCPYQVTRQSR